METAHKENQGKTVFAEKGEKDDRFDEVMADMNQATYRALLGQ
jgi:hypothetical protein